MSSLCLGFKELAAAGKVCPRQIPKAARRVSKLPLSSPGRDEGFLPHLPPQMMSPSQVTSKDLMGNRILALWMPQ